MTALTDYAENLLLAWFFTNGAATRPTEWHVALHTEDPTDAGDQGELSTGQDTSYLRKAVTMGAPALGQSLSATQVSWTMGTVATGFTITHASVWDASTGGNCLIKGQLTAARAMTTGDVITFEIGEIIAALD